jgi:hypothetical protein
MNREKCLSFALTIVLFNGAVLLAPAQDNTILTLADRYSTSLKRFEARKGHSSLESVVHTGKAVNEKIGEIEALSDANYSLLLKKMKGFTINREEILFIEPRAEFFSRLAQTHGTRSDLTFFTLLHQIKPGNVWRVYIEPQTDVTGCTIYGNGILTKLYGKALRFKKTYPQAFTADINDEIDEILEQFSEGGCSCGSRSGVVREFQLFIRTFPRDKHTPKIKKALKTFIDRGDFRFNCHSG